MTADGTSEGPTSRRLMTTYRPCARRSGLRTTPGRAPTVGRVGPQPATRLRRSATGPRTFRTSRSAATRSSDRIVDGRRPAATRTSSRRRPSWRGNGKWRSVGVRWYGRCDSDRPNERPAMTGDIYVYRFLFKKIDFHRQYIDFLNRHCNHVFHWFFFFFFLKIESTCWGGRHSA